MSRTKLAMNDDFYNDDDYFYYHQVERVEERKKCNYDSKMADESIKHCTKCNKCFERTILRNYRKKNKIVIFYEDFPTFGKEKEVCLLCNGSEYKKSMYGEIICYELIEPTYNVFGDKEHKTTQDQLDSLTIMGV